MKKLLSALLIALLLSTMMLMSACNDASKTSDDKLSFDYTTNFQYYYSNLNGINFPVTKSEKGYYVFLPNNYLYYIDRESQAAHRYVTSLIVRITVLIVMHTLIYL